MISHHVTDPDSDHQLEPGGEPGDDLGEEGGNGVAVVRFVELGLVQAIHQDDVILLSDLPLCIINRQGSESTRHPMEAGVNDTLVS